LGGLAQGGDFGFRQAGQLLLALLDGLA